MRIALISQEYPPETGSGGIGTQTYQKAHGLAARGHDLHVISHSMDERRHEYQQSSVNIIRIPGFDSELRIATDAARWLTYSAGVAAELGRLHSRLGVDLAEFPDWGCEAFVHLLNRTPENRIPTAIHLHGPLVMFAHALGWPEIDSEFYRVARMMEETCLRLADAVFSSSRCSADWCARHYALDSEAMPIIHTGIDARSFRPLSVPKSECPTIVFVGRLERNKGVDLLVEAGCRLAEKYSNLRIRLIGRGNANVVQELVQKVASAGHPNLIELVGYVRRDELPELLSRADVFAAPSDYEGGPGFVYLEAMACGLPVIACQGSGVSDVVEDGETGFLVPPRDVDSLHNALNRLLSDENMRRTMGRCAREYVEREANADECLDRLESFYGDVVQKCHRSPEYV
jgi:glycosyltransferase involved in cell wall biosynthesis